MTASDKGDLMFTIYILDHKLNTEISSWISHTWAAKEVLHSSWWRKSENPGRETGDGPETPVLRSLFRRHPLYSHTIPRWSRLWSCSLTVKRTLLQWVEGRGYAQCVDAWDDILNLSRKYVDVCYSHQQGFRESYFIRARGSQRPGVAILHEPQGL